MSTHKDWFKAILSEDNHLRVDISFDLYDHRKLDFKSAALLTARLIGDRYKKIYVAYSGGYDSELVCKSFLEANIQFTPVCVINPFEPSEIEYAFYFCKQYSLNPIILDLTLDKFAKISNLLMKKYKNLPIFPGLTPRFLVDAFIKDKDAVIVDGECHPFNDPVLLPLQHLPHEFYLDKLGKHQHIHFFNYTVEIYRACYEEALKTDLPTQYFKAKLFDLPFRPKLKCNWPLTLDTWNKTYDVIEEILIEYNNGFSKQDANFISQDLIDQIIGKSQ